MFPSFFLLFCSSDISLSVFSNASCTGDFGTKNDNIPSIVHINWNLKNTNFWGPGITIVSTAPNTIPKNKDIWPIWKSEYSLDINNQTLYGINFAPSHTKNNNVINSGESAVRTVMPSINSVLTYPFEYTPHAMHIMHIPVNARQNRNNLIIPNTIFPPIRKLPGHPWQPPSVSLSL